VIAEARRREISERLHAVGTVSVAEVETQFGVSPMTARRDLAELERRGVLRRTHGGAVLPQHATHEDSFARRLEIAADAKLRLAEAAVDLVAPRESVFLDSSTTSYFVARRLVETGLSATVLTNCLPIMELVFEQGGPRVDLIGIGGTFRRLTRSFVGPFAVDAIRGHVADRVFLSVKGLAGNGALTDPDPLEAEVKRTMIEQAAEATLLIDGSKLSDRGLSVIAPLGEVAGVIADGLSPEQREWVQARGGSLRALTGSASAED